MQSRKCIFYNFRKFKHILVDVWTFVGYDKDKVSIGVERKENMDLQECYQKMAADYPSVSARFGNDATICRFLMKYLQRHEMENLKTALQEGKYKDAFICAHNMKGYGLNLSLTHLHVSSGILCEALRDGEPKGDINAMLAEVEAAYREMEEAVSQLEFQYDA